MFNTMLTTPASNNLVVPLIILSLDATATGANLEVQIDLRRQYYRNATIRFVVENAAALRFQGVPVETALRATGDGHWREVYDQDQHFQTIGRVTKDPAWSIDLQDHRRLLKTTVVAAIEKQFVSFVEAVYKQHLDSHDILLEITGDSYVQPGFPKTENGIQNFGLVNLQISKFDAIYIVPKGGPSGSAILS